MPLHTRVYTYPALLPRSSRADRRLSRTIIAPDLPKVARVSTRFLAVSGSGTADLAITARSDHRERVHSSPDAESVNTPRWLRRAGERVRDPSRGVAIRVIRRAGASTRALPAARRDRSDAPGLRLSDEYVRAVCSRSVALRCSQSPCRIEATLSPHGGAGVSAAGLRLDGYRRLIGSRMLGAGRAIRPGRQTPRAVTEKAGQNLSFA